METSNNGHQLLVEESSNHPGQLRYQTILEDGYLELSLNHPSIGQVMQVTITLCKYSLSPLHNYYMHDPELSSL